MGRHRQCMPSLSVKMSSKADPSSGINPAVKCGIIGAMMALYSLQSLLITASKSGGSGYSYDPNSAVLMTEFTKAIIAGSLLFKSYSESPAPTQITVDKTVFRYAIPALLYAIHNNLVFLGLVYLDHCGQDSLSVRNPCAPVRNTQQSGVPGLGLLGRANLPAAEQRQDHRHRALVPYIPEEAPPDGSMDRIGSVDAWSNGGDDGHHWSCPKRREITDVRHRGHGDGRACIHVRHGRRLQ